MADKLRVTVLGTGTIGYGMAVSPAHLDGTYQRLSGDFAELGKGEILEWNAA